MKKWITSGKSQKKKLMNKEFEKSQFIVDEKQTQIRVDLFLFDRMPNVTRNKIQEGIKNGQVIVNKKKLNQVIG